MGLLEYLHGLINTKNESVVNPNILANDSPVMTIPSVGYDAGQQVKGNKFIPIDYKDIVSQYDSNLLVNDSPNQKTTEQQLLEMKQNSPFNKIKKAIGTGVEAIGDTGRLLYDEARLASSIPYDWFMGNPIAATDSRNPEYQNIRDAIGRTISDNYAGVYQNKNTNKLSNKTPEQIKLETAQAEANLAKVKANEVADQNKKLQEVVKKAISGTANVDTNAKQKAYDDLIQKTTTGTLLKPTSAPESILTSASGGFGSLVDKLIGGVTNTPIPKDSKGFFENLGKSIGSFLSQEMSSYDTGVGRRGIINTMIGNSLRQYNPNMAKGWDDMSAAQQERHLAQLKLDDEAKKRIQDLAIEQARAKALENKEALGRQNALDVANIRSNNEGRGANVSTLVDMAKGYKESDQSLSDDQSLLKAYIITGTKLTPALQEIYNSNQELVNKTNGTKKILQDAIISYPDIKTAINSIENDPTQKDIVVKYFGSMYNFYNEANKAYELKSKQEKENDKLAKKYNKIIKKK